MPTLETIRAELQPNRLKDILIDLKEVTLTEELKSHDVFEFMRQEHDPHRMYKLACLYVKLMNNEKN